MQHVTIVGFRKTLGTSITIPMEMLNAADLINRIKGAGYRKLHMQLVSPDEINPACNYISVDSVLARALLGKSLDTEVTVQTPSGPRTYVIADIEYPPIPAEMPASANNAADSD